MKSRSLEFDKEINTGYHSVTKAELWLRTRFLGEIEVLGGTWKADQTSAIRSSITLELPATKDFLPKAQWEKDSVSNGVWPVGLEVQLYAGLRYQNNTEELIPLGRFGLTKPKVQDNDVSLTLSLEGFDRSRAVSRARFLEPYSIPGNTDYATAIRNLVQSRLPWLGEDEFQFFATDGSDGHPIYVTPWLYYNYNDDPWAVCQKLATACGAEIFWDGEGRCVLRKVVDLSYDSPDWIYEEGNNANILDVGRELDDEEAYNGIILVAENTELNQSIISRVWDTNPDSPTYFNPDMPYESTYGAYPYYETVEYVLDKGQLDEMAQAMFLTKCGITEAVTLSAIPHPAHEPGDVIKVLRERAGVDGVYVIDSISMGLGYTGVIEIKARTRRING